MSKHQNEEILNKLWHQPNEALEELANSQFTINSSGNLSCQECLDQIKQLKAGLGDLTLDVTHSAENHLVYQITGIHNGILFNTLPTQKECCFSGSLIINNEESDQQIYLSFDFKTLLETIHNFSNKTYTEEDFPDNDFSGPAGDIYRSILSSRNPPCGIDQLLVNKFRWMLSQVNPDYLPEVPYLEQMNQEVDVEDLKLPINGTNLRVRWYKPNTVDYQQCPTLVYFHGGGWVMASVDSYDLVTKKLAWKGQVNVFSIDYRLAPEHPFPTYYMDCYQGFQYIQEHLNQFGIQSEKIAVAGDSVGGTMTAGVMEYCRQHNKKTPDALMMLSPATDLLFESYPSFIEKSRNSVFISLGLALFQRSACVPIEYWKDPLYSPMYAGFKDFPPTLVMIGEDDPLIDDNQRVVQELRSAGNPDAVELLGKRMPHAYHIFIGMTEAEETAYQTMADFLKKHLC